ncbi:MAG TPA: cyclic nucleotide-binding domain-containing protein [Polyangiaceae bacterium]|nr:cyclic nucleotide-binding domain-containing protein [Polyangiaceae bacterium]
MTIGAPAAQELSPYETELARRVEAQAAACIGCNDCLLACPISESANVTIGELNRALFLPVIQERRVIEFVSACTQCNQCVPACPADLSRAEMVLFNKLKVEDTVADYELSLSARTVTFPSGMRLDELARELGKLELFRGASFLALRRLIQKSTLRLLVPGETLCSEGEYHERLSVVLKGGLGQYSRGARGESTHLLTLGPGSFLGELSVLGGAPEPHTIIAQTTSVVLDAPKAAVLRVMAQAPDVRHALESLYAKRALYTYAKSPGALGALPDEAIRYLLENASLEFMASGQRLFEIGEPPQALFLVRSGFLRAVQRDAQGERVLTYFREGDVFGLLGLLERDAGQRYAAHAASRAEVIRIPSAVLFAVLAHHPTAQAALARAAYQAEQLARSGEIGLGPVPQAARARSLSGSPEPSLPGERERLGASVLVERGLASGREVLVIDQTRCTACGNCIDSCERRHGASRLSLRGIQVDQYLFPSACRHCADPACLLCSVNGIVRLPSGEIQIVRDTCIGCGACAERCPYGTISMHAAQTPKPSLWASLLDFLAGSTREESVRVASPDEPRVAVKCDLCAGHADYACVSACPTAAAFRVNPDRVLGEGEGSNRSASSPRRGKP